MSATIPITPPVKKTMTWNDETDKQLLMAIIAQFDYKYDSTAVAAMFGPWCTPRAVEERVKKLKKQAKAESHPTSPLCPGQSTKVEEEIQAHHAADIEAFHYRSAEKQAVTQAAITTAAQTTPTKASKATATKIIPAFRTKKGTAIRIKKGKGKTVDVANGDESMAKACDTAMSSARKRKFDDTEDADSDGATISAKKARKAEAAIDDGSFLA